MIEVTNQPPPLENYNLFSSDVILGEALKRENAGWAAAELRSGVTGAPVTEITPCTGASPLLRTTSPALVRSAARKLR